MLIYSSSGGRRDQACAAPVPGGAACHPMFVFLTAGSVHAFCATSYPGRCKKNEQGHDPAPNHANQLIGYAYASILSVIHRDARGFAPACPPKTWTARDLDR